ncbi:PD-(D/E)XK motif protein [Micromonospora soli]|uniref:PD-(D/E)XK motif protein n=1 Tax=Micromonospora sp. NBRC 110009 TaxID=3061627 RepID=UPI00267283EF|nr:PD-(D/E)XK motif protein [Micromonospora sp. NBRC 110009]WKT99924.1 PD-(D/E)XK motif protein [Micromonospora sp. NBRC 110009]
MRESEPNMLERAWAVLVPPRGKALTSFPLEVLCGKEPCRVALDAAGARHLLVPAGDQAVTVDTKPAVLRLAIRKLGFGGAALTYIDVSCAEADLFPEFDEVVTDVLEAVSDAPRPASAAVEAVTRWRRLFRSSLLRGMSRQAKLGLFAELVMLSALVEADPGFPVQAWRGPLNEPHDFESTARCLEVKALSAVGDGIIVHGLEQLNTHDDRPLDLVLIRVLEDPDGSSVSDRVRWLRGVVASRSDLRTRLSAVGWSEQPDRPDLDMFAVGEVLRVVVDGETPRVVPTSLVAGGLPSGIDKLSYQVDLAALLPLAAGASLSEIAEEAVR